MRGRVKHGVTPVKRDGRDFSFHRTFPRHYQKAGATGLPNMVYNHDARFGMPDQVAENLPMGCTGYAQTELCQDQDNCRYSPRITYYDTIKFANGKDGDGCNMRDSLSMILDPGPMRTDDGVRKPRKGYFSIDKAPGFDWFDSIRIALRSSGTEKRSVSFTTPWYPSFEDTPHTGKVADTLYGDPDVLPWHNHKLCGETLFDADPYLIDKSWQGSEIGDAGYLYFNRALINEMMTVPGSACFTVTAVDGVDIKTVTLFKYEHLFIFVRRLLALLLSRRA